MKYASVVKDINFSMEYIRKSCHTLVHFHMLVLSAEMYLDNREISRSELDEMF